jgi:hypothetical protein
MSVGASNTCNTALLLNAVVVARMRDAGSSHAHEGHSDHAVAGHLLAAISDHSPEGTRGPAEAHTEPTLPVKARNIRLTCAGLHSWREGF